MYGDLKMDLHVFIKIYKCAFIFLYTGVGIYSLKTLVYILIQKFIPHKYNQL